MFDDSSSSESDYYTGYDSDEVMLLRTETDTDMWTEYSDSEEEADLVFKGRPNGMCGICTGYHKRHLVFPDELKNFLPGRKRYFTDTFLESESFLELSQLCDKLKNVINHLIKEFSEFDRHSHYILQKGEYDDNAYEGNMAQFFEKGENTDYKFIMNEFINKIDFIKTKSKSKARASLCRVFPENVPDLVIDKLMSYLDGMEDFTKENYRFEQPRDEEKEVLDLMFRVLCEVYMTGIMIESRMLCFCCDAKLDFLSQLSKFNKNDFSPWKPGWREADFCDCGYHCNCEDEAEKRKKEMQECLEREKVLIENFEADIV